MPLLSGYDLIRRARQRGNRVPMIAVTAFDTSEHRRQILRHGFAYHLTKPFDPNLLLAVVGETVGTGAMHQIN
jgi:CheY-like chemotaxis protein